MATVSNNSRNYYISNQNMSDIKESIQEYSMNFQQGMSGTGSQIAQMISGSHQVSQSRQSKFVPKSKPTLPKPEVIIQENNYMAMGDQQEQEEKKGVYLGDQIFAIVRERYFETNKITTDDPEVLYDFYLGQRKNLHSMKPVTEKEIERQMPSMQRKLLVKFKFQKILTYYPEDVYYSLCYFQKKQQLDRKTTQNMEVLQKQSKIPIKKKVTKEQMNKIVEKLYKNTKKTKKDEKDKSIQEMTREISKEEIQKQKRNKFGRNLSEHFQNTYRDKEAPINIETVEKLFSFWSDLYEREEYGIEWNEDTAFQTIERYMYEQIEDLMQYAARKLGFKCTKADSLFKFYQKNEEKVNKFIFIPMHCFQEYVRVYNKVELRKQEEEQKIFEKKQIKENKKQKMHEVKQFGRPVSATPLSILSQPKSQSLCKQKQQLFSKYPSNQLLKNMKVEENLKKARYAFQYGVYDLMDEAKTKQWVKIDPKKKVPHEMVLTSQLMSSFGDGGWVKKQEKNDRLSEIFAEEDLAQKEHWKKLGPVLHEAMLVKAYENQWFIDCIIKYLQRVLGESDLKLETNTKLFKKLFHYLTNELDENSRQSELSKLQTYILTSQSIAEKTNKINAMTSDPKANANKMRKERRLVNDKLQEKAIEWVKMRNKDEGNKKIMRSFLKELFDEVMKEHKEYVTRQFHVVEGSQDVPKLLKYEFFKMIKQINPITLERDFNPRSYAWVPPKSHALTQQNINYKTFNHVSGEGKRRNGPHEPESDHMKRELWGWRNEKDRELVMMSYEDAKECVFHPKISKKDM